MTEPRGRLHLVRDTGRAAPPRDEDLVAAFLDDRPGASAALWERCYPVVRRIVFRLGGPNLDADDVVQEVFIRLYRKLPDLRDPSSLQSFVLAITVRVVKGQQRLGWMRRWLGLWKDGEPPEGTAEDADLEAREAVARFYDILGRLSPKHRTAFVLRYVEELELGEVAGAIGVSLATVKRWLPRISRRVFSQARHDPMLASYLAGGTLRGET